MIYFKDNSFSHDEITTCAFLLNEGLGQNSYSTEELKPFAKQYSNKILITAHLKDQLVGIIISERFTPANCKRITKELHKIDIDPGIEKTAILKAAAVKLKLRGRGIGVALIKKALQKVKSEKYKYAIGTVWDIPENPVKKIFNSIGFKELSLINTYWTGESIQKKYQCPICGNPCFCNAILNYIKI
ncbi:GNAT family N-acetyltransferase [Marinilabiliaceae bacterium ANBcel2]|nr:GNAT family N-acetyltransferase [Marinilabiliaceae bacterium ANBcel2]